MPEQAKRRVAVTGMGAVTAIGHSMSDTWQGILEGRIGAGTIKSFPAERMPVRIAYEVKDYTFDRGGLSETEALDLYASGRYAIAAAREAVAQSGISKASSDPYRRMVSMGSGMGSPSVDWYTNIYLENNWDDPEVAHVCKDFPYIQNNILCRLLGAKGGAVTSHTACASSGQSIGEAYERIAFDEADVVLTGGSDSMINAFHVAGFALLGALSKRNDEPQKASRPFDVDRDGFVLAEGACAFVLEEWEQAKARGAKILGEIVGYGITESAYRITDLHPDGRGPVEAMQMAIEDAGVAPEEVGYINAHGTSTLLNDRIESMAISKVFPRESLHVSSTKSMTGHLISAAGAMELGVCVQALAHQVLPPSANLDEVDPACQATFCGKDPEAKAMEYALSNSVGFGGSNTALVARRVK